MRPLYRKFLLFLVVPIALGVIVFLTLWATALRRESKSRSAAVPVSGRFVTGGDVEMFVQLAGPDDGPPVLLVHGTGAWSQIWRPTMEALAGAGYRAIAIDLPPFGFSEKPASARYDDAAQAARIIGVLNALEVHSVTLVGHSFGARPTVEAALTDPSRVRLLVLVDAALNPRPNGAAPLQASGVVRTLVSTPWIREPLVAATLTNPMFTRRLLQKLILDPADATDAQVRMVQDQFRVEGTTRAVGAWLRPFALDDATAMNHDAARYATLTMPTLLLWGEKDVITPLARGQALLALLPSAELVTLPNTGHIPAIEDAARFNAALLAFLAAHQPPRPT